MAKIYNEIAIRTSEDGLMKIDGVPMFRKVIHNGVTYLQFCDKDRMRSNCRATRLVEVRLDVLMLAIEKAVIDGSANGTE